MDFLPAAGRALPELAELFTRSFEGYVVPVRIEPEFLARVIPEDAIEITVNESGEIYVSLDGQVEPQLVGQFQLATFANEAGLEALGSNLFLETPASGDAINGTPQSEGFGEIGQGMLETSNVDIVSEITRLIEAQRAYEMSSKTITTTDEMMRTTTNMR